MGPGRHVDISQAREEGRALPAEVREWEKVVEVGGGDDVRLPGGGPSSPEQGELRSRRRARAALRELVSVRSS